MEFDAEEYVALQQVISGIYRNDEPQQSDNDPTNAAQYGRIHGLTVDSESIDTLSGALDVRKDLMVLGDDALLDDSNLAPCILRPIIFPREQLAVGSASSKFLGQVLKPLDEQALAHLRANVNLFDRSSRHLKLEPPALFTDHEVDFRQYCRDMEAFRQIYLRDHRLPLEPTDREKDEGLEFPRALDDLGERLFASLEKELMDMSKENMEFAVSCLQRDWTEREQQDMIESLTAYKGLTASPRLTPMMTPLLSPVEPYVPDEEICRVPIPSDMSSKLSPDLRAAEDAVFDLDGNPDFLTSETMLSSGSPERYEDVDVSKFMLDGGLEDFCLGDSNVVWRSVDHLKLDVPLMNDESDNVTMSPGISNTDKLADNNLMTLEDLDVLMASLDDEEVTRMMDKNATDITRSIEQEKLNPTDTTARLPVPVLDFHLPEPEWQKQRKDPMALFNWVRRNTETAWEAPKWPRKSQAEEMKMVWTPMSAKIWGNVVYRKETIEVESQTFARFLELPKLVMTSADLVWKREGLAILHADEDEEDDENILPPPEHTSAHRHQGPATNIERRKDELGLGEQTLEKTFPTLAPLERHHDSLMLARKRKIEEGSEASRVRKLGSTQVATTATIAEDQFPQEDLMAILKRRRQDLEPEWNRQKSELRATQDVALNGSGSTRSLLTKKDHDASASLLANYMELKASKYSRLSHSSFVGSSQTKPARRATSIYSLASNEVQRNTDATTMPPPSKPLPVAAPPEFSIPESPIRVVVARIPGRVLSLLHNELPGIEMIERDYDAHNSTTWHPGSVISSVVLSPLADEADIIVSPTTGILITTMLRVRQKPLPGSKTKAFLRARIEMISARYERLLIIVSEGNTYSESVHKMAPTDVAVLAEFRGFAEGLGSHTSVYYVGGGELTVAKWAAALICRHAAESTDTHQYTLHAETRGELFLRRAGMNVYAAQVVLGMTRAPPNVPAMGTDCIYGLAAVLKLSLEQRIAHFEKTLGGRRLLEITSQNIDKNWDD